MLLRKNRGSIYFTFHMNTFHNFSARKSICILQRKKKSNRVLKYLKNIKADINNTGINNMLACI